MAPNTAVTLTKLQPPRVRAGLIARGRVEQILGEALAGRRLTLLCAPAGFGKTTALARQILLLPKGTAVAWITADEHDDLHRFLRCLFLALEPFDLPWRIDPTALVAAATAGHPDLDSAVAGLVNAMSGCEVPRGLVVLDDGHRITDPAVFKFLQLLLDRLPAHWGVVLSSRVEPPLKLARMRARDELGELRQDELAFTQEETAALVACGGAGPDSAQLVARTGGWAAGLRLVLNAHRPDARHRATSLAVDRHMFDFLASEVLAELPGELYEFLLRCSVLPELTPRRCLAVTGMTNSADLMAQIEQRGLFVSVHGGREPALTLHDLFRDCLSERLRRDHPELLPELLRRAADVEPDPIRRLYCLLRAGEWDAAEQLMEKVAEAMLADGATEPVLRLIEQFPEDRRKQSPLLALLRGQVAWERWDWRGMLEEMRRAIAGFEASEDRERLHRARVFEATAMVGGGWVADSRERLAGISLRDADLETRALALALDTWHAIDSREFHRVPSGYMAMLDLLEQTDRPRIWNHCFQRPLYVWMPGMAAPLARMVDASLRRAGDAPTQMRTIAHVMAAWLALWRGELGPALEHVDQAQRDARWLNTPIRLSMFEGTARAIVHAIRGERAEAISAMDGVLAYFPSARPSGPLEQPTSMLGHYLFLAARLADTLGDARCLRGFLARIPAPVCIKNYDMLRPQLATVPARLATLDGKFEEAASIWSEVLRDEASIEVLGLAEESRLRYADVLLQIGRRPEAAGALKSVLARVARSGELGGVLLAGSDVLGRLAGVAWRDELDWTELAMLRGWAQRYGAPAAPAPSKAGTGPLSARELEVLARISAGESNKTIARALKLSPHTVKRHVANILDKLGLYSRSQAAHWFRSQ